MKKLTKTLGATYDGKVFIPDEPVDLPPNTHVTITIEILFNVSDEKDGLVDRFEQLFGSASDAK